MKTAAERLLSIQMLRGVAAIVVLVAHLQKEIRTTLGPTWLDNTTIEVIGQAGVDLFFVISGFIMVYVTRRQPPTGATVANFAIKRVFRIVPLYWILTLLTLSISLVDPTVKNHNPDSPWYVVGSFLFLPVPRVDDGHFTPVLGVGWTLNYEMMFYAVFCAVLLLNARFRIPALIGALAVLVIAGAFVPESWAQLWFWTRPIILEFAMGAALAFLYIRGVRLSAPLGAVLAVLGLGGVIASGALPSPTDYDVRVWAWGVPAALLFAGVVLAKRSILDILPDSAERAFARLGDGSYSLYLVHMFVIRATTIGLERLGVEGVWYVVFAYVIVIAVSIPLADLLYRRVELPISGLSRRFLIPERAATIA